MLVVGALALGLERRAERWGWGWGCLLPTARGPSSGALVRGGGGGWRVAAARCNRNNRRLRTSAGKRQSSKCAVRRPAATSAPPAFCFLGPCVCVVLRPCRIRGAAVVYHERRVVVSCAVLCVCVWEWEWGGRALGGERAQRAIYNSPLDTCPCAQYASCTLDRCWRCRARSPSRPCGSSAHIGSVGHHSGFKNARNAI